MSYNCNHVTYLWVYQMLSLLFLKKGPKPHHSENCGPIETVFFFFLTVLFVFVVRYWVNTLKCCRSSSALSSHTCTHKYQLKACTPNPFISLYLLKQTVLLLQPTTRKAKLSATLGSVGLYPAAVLESRPPTSS